MADSIALPLPACPVQDPAQTPSPSVVDRESTTIEAQHTSSTVSSEIEPVGPSPYDTPAVLGRSEGHPTTALARQAQALEPTRAAPVPGNGRDAKGRLLPGHGGVPGSGRPKGLAARVRQMVDFDKAITTLVEIAWGKLAPSARMADRIKAIEILFDRGYGKPQVTVDIKEGSGANRDKLRSLSFGELVAATEAMRSLASGNRDDVTDAEEVH